MYLEGYLHEIQMPIAFIEMSLFHWIHWVQSSLLWQLLFGWQEGHPACEKYCHDNFPKFYFLVTGLTWNNSRKTSRLNKKCVHPCMRACITCMLLCQYVGNNNTIILALSLRVQKIMLWKALKTAVSNTSLSFDTRKCPYKPYIVRI